MTAPVGLSGVEHIVVLMLENRSFDHMIGYLYSEHNNVSPRGDAFDGLTGQESCPDSAGNAVSVYQITPDTRYSSSPPHLVTFTPSDDALQVSLILATNTGGWNGVGSRAGWWYRRL